MAKLKSLRMALMLMTMAGAAHAKTLVLYTFTGETFAPESVADDLSATDFAVSQNQITFTTGNEQLWLDAGATMPSVSSPNSWTSGDQASAKHYYIELQAEPGKAVTITNLTYFHFSQFSGPTNVGFSINGVSTHAQEFAVDVVEQVNEAVTGFENLTNTVVIRFEGWNAPANGAYRMNNVHVQGFVADEVTGETPPTVSTPTSADVSQTTATLGGTITDTGDTDVVERGIYWSKTPDFDPETEGTRVWQGGTFGTGAFTVHVTDLPPATTIYFVAYARGVVTGTVFSEEDSFTTLSAPPTMAAAPVPDTILPGTAQLGGEILADNGETITRRGVVWSTTPGFDTSTGTIADESGSFAIGSFSVNVTGLPELQRVYYRAFAENSLGLVYSAQGSFYAPPAGTLAFFSFDDEQPEPDVMAENLTVGSLTISEGSIGFGSTVAFLWTGSGVPYATASGGWNAGSQTAAKYYEITLAAQGAYAITITNISLRFLSPSDGPSAVGLALNGDTIHEQNTADGQVEIMTTAVTGFEGEESATIRIQGWVNGSRSTPGTGDLWIDDILVQGVVESPAEPQAVELGISLSAAAFDFSFPSETGFNYRLEFTTNLVGPSVNWQEIDTVPGDGDTIEIIDPDPQDAMRIYRIMAE